MNFLYAYGRCIASGSPAKRGRLGGKEGGSVFRFLIKVQKQMKLFGSRCCKQNRDMERILDPVARWFP